jgi:hypothetical protein
MRTHLLLLAIVLIAACKSKGNPADCIDKRDYGACTKLCESGDKANMRFCFAERAFKMADCVDKGQGCDQPCKDWASMQRGAAMGDTDPVDTYKSFIAAKYDQMAAKCGSAAAPAPAGDAPPTGSATPPDGSAMAPAGSGSAMAPAGSGSAAP